MQLQKKYPNDLVAITLDIDHDEDGAPTQKLQDEVLAKLKELKMNVTNVMSSDVTGDVLDRHELFSIPAALIYDRDGKLHQKFEGDLSYEKQVEPLIAEMLKPGE